MNVFKEMGCAIAKPSVYPHFLRNKGGRIFGYGMLLMLFYFLLSVIVPAGVLQVQTGGFIRVIRDEVPDFELSHFGFWVEHPYSLEEGDFCVRLNSEQIFNEEEIYRLSRRYDKMICIDAEKIIIKNQGQVQTAYFEMLDYDTYLSKQDILAIIPMIYLVLFVIGIFAFVWMSALFFLGVLLVSLPGLIINAVLKADLTFGQIYKLALYGRTLPLLFKGVVLRAFSISIPFFWVINFGVTLVYLYFAMKKIGEQKAQYAYAQGGYTSYAQTGYGQDIYQQNVYNQNGYQQNPYEQNRYQQTPYQQNPYNQNYQSGDEENK